METSMASMMISLETSMASITISEPLPRNEEKSLKMVCGAFYIAKGKDSKPQGEDAHFICEEKQTIGIADGVGGCSKYGGDGGEYARTLMAYSLEAVQNKAMEDIVPTRILNKAYSHTHVKGSSTACVVILKDNHLHAANVGDSGFLLIREGQDVYKSPIQQWSFNCPYQIGRSAARPSIAQEFEIPVRKGDILVVGTDGLLDNMFPRDIENLAKVVSANGAEPEQVAWAIAEHAYYNSVDKHASTPFVEASLLAGKQHLGGKKDDITVIVAHIIDK